MTWHETEPVVHRRTRARVAAACTLAIGVIAVSVVGLPAQQRPAGPGAVTFWQDVSPILQRKCQRCHRPDAPGPMSLMTYEQVRPFARAIHLKTSRREMPPWYIEKGVGIQKFVEDASLSETELATIARWVESGAPEGTPVALPPLPTGMASKWTLGQPDLIVESPSVTMPPMSPDWWGSIGDTATGLTEDRYIASAETIEINDAPPGKPAYVFHHAVFSVLTADGQIESSYAPHEVGRNADIYDPEMGKPLRAGSRIDFSNMHLHANGSKTKARLAIGFKFHPRGYQPKYKVQGIGLGSIELDVRGNQANQMMEAFTTLTRPARILSFEPHMHAAGSRMCVEAIYGNVKQTLSCAGFNHAWILNYQYAANSTPLLPAGTTLHIVGWVDTTPKNTLLVDYRNWTGWGSRSLENMLANNGIMTYLTDEQFKEEVAKREAAIRRGEGELLGCFTCDPSLASLAAQNAK